MTSTMVPELQQLTTAKLVLLGEMGSGKSSLVLRYVKGQFFDYQVCLCLRTARTFAWWPLPGRAWPYTVAFKVLERNHSTRLAACPCYTSAASPQ